MRLVASKMHKLNRNIEQLLLASFQTVLNKIWLRRGLKDKLILLT